MDKTIGGYRPWIASSPQRSTLSLVERFAVIESAAPAGWLLFSWWQWGDPMILPRQTIAENLSKIETLRAVGRTTCDRG